MAQNIHPTAIVSDKAQIADNVCIGPCALIEENTFIGEGTKIDAFSSIKKYTRIGKNNHIYSYAMVGEEPQDLKFDGEESWLEIGDNNRIREFSTLHRGTASGGSKTIIGNNCLLMAYTHVAHDCVLGNHVIMANNATLGGHVIVGDHVLIGGLSAVHQFIRVGSFAVIGGMSGVESDVIPYGRVKGERAFLAGLNLIGLERNGFDKDQIRYLQRAFNELFGDEGTLEQRIDMVANDFSTSQAVMQIIDFARSKTRFPLCTPQKKMA